jgi:hypothetical protein
MQDFVGIRGDGPDAVDAVEYVRGLRQGHRLDGLVKE